MNEQRESKQGLDWTGNQRSIYTTLGASNHTDKERQQHDYYATEPMPILRLTMEQKRLSERKAKQRNGLMT